jgi:hypothetical protein
MLAEMHERLMQAVRRYDQLQEQQEAYSARRRESQTHHHPGAYRAVAPAGPEYVGYPTMPQQHSYYLPAPLTLTGTNQQHPPTHAPHALQSADMSAVSRPYNDRAGPSDYQARQMHAQSIESLATDHRLERSHLDSAYRSYPVAHPPAALPTQASQPEVYAPVPLVQTGLSIPSNAGPQDEAWASSFLPRTEEETFPALPDAPNHALPRIDRESAPGTEVAEEPLLIEL